MMRALTLTAGTFVVLILSTSSVSACSCKPPKPQKLFREARAVFVGEVVDITESTVPLGKGFPPLSYAVKFKISKYWKGVDGSHITVHSDLGGLHCHQFSFRKGEKYFVYAFGKDLIATTGCTRSGPIDEEFVMEQLKLFGKGKVPRPRFITSACGGMESACLLSRLAHDAVVALPVKPRLGWLPY